MNPSISPEQIASFRKGNEQAFKRIYEVYWYYLHSIVYRFTRSSETADDIVQEVFTDLWIQRDRIDADKPIKPYLRSMVRFKVISYLRNLSVRKQESFLSLVTHEYYHNGTVNSVQEYIDYTDVQQWLERELERVPGKSKTIFCMSRMDNLTNREIAERLNLSVKNVEFHITKTLASLRGSMIKQAVFPTLGILFLLFF